MVRLEWVTHHQHRSPSRQSRNTVSDFCDEAVLQSESGGTPDEEIHAIDREEELRIASLGWETHP